MSELITRTPTAKFRSQWLTTVSALTLFLTVSTSANAEDGNRPTVWVELGGQLARVDGGQEQFVPPFIIATPRPAPEVVSPLDVGHPPRNSFGGEGKISFEPRDTTWVFTAAARFGRSSASKHLHQQSYPTKAPIPPLSSGQFIHFQYALPFSDASRKDSESHAVLDFQAGKDVGVGLFGAGSTSVLSIGVRFAQFESKSNINLKSDPNAHVTYKYAGPYKFLNGAVYNLNAASLSSQRSFHGMGPSISWNASTSVAGDPSDAQLLLDWGVNAAVLFGRQKAHVHRQITGWYHSGTYQSFSQFNTRHTVYRNAPPDQVRSHSVVVPNFGGFAGVSFRYDAAKLSFGYRADFFFGAIDGGIDTRKSYNRSFYGPFATVSVGLGG